MAQGGWICKQVTIERSQLVAPQQDVFDLMCLFKDAIVSAGIWRLDPDIHTGANADYPIQIDSTNYIWTHGLYFVNDAGAKLALTYSWSGSSYPVDNKSMNDGGSCMGGIVISMIPPGCGSYVPSSISSIDDYSPAYATPPVGTCGRSAIGGGSATGGETASDSALKYMQVKATTDGWCKWTFLMRGNVFIVFFRNSWKGPDRESMICCGEIVGECIHQSDSGIGTRYGCLSSGCGPYEAADLTGFPANIRGDNIRFSRENFSSVTYFRGSFRQAEYSSDNRGHESNGMWKTGAACWVTGGNYGPDIAGDNTFHNAIQSGVVLAWPLMVGFGRSFRVVYGSGFKGYLDPEVFLGTGSNLARGQKVDGGNYIYVGGGLLVGWDDSLDASVLF